MTRYERLKQRRELRRGLTPSGTLNRHTRKVRGKYKSVCTSAVLAYFGITPDKYKPHDCTSESVMKILKRNKLKCKSVFESEIYSGAVKRVSYVKDRISRTIDTSSNYTDFYYISVKCKRGWHAMLISKAGHTLVDTSPRIRDGRRVRKVVRVRVKAGYDYDSDNHQLQITR